VLTQCRLAATEGQLNTAAVVSGEQGSVKRCRLAASEGHQNTLHSSVDSGEWSTASWNGHSSNCKIRL
jgi:hypothetical protein